MSMQNSADAIAGRCRCHYRTVLMTLQDGADVIAKTIIFLAMVCTFSKFRVIKENKRNKSTNERK